MFFETSNMDIYGDTTDDIVAALIPGYGKQIGRTDPARDKRFLRYLFCVGIAAVAQDLLIEEHIKRPDYQDPPMSVICRLHDPKYEIARLTPEMNPWECEIPLVLVVDNYLKAAEPFPKGNIVWLDSISSDRLLETMQIAKMGKLYHWETTVDE